MRVRFSALAQKFLHEIPAGKKVRILGNIRETGGVNFLALGLLPGDEITVRHVAPFGGPLAVETNGTLVAIRREDACTIHVEVEE